MEYISSDTNVWIDFSVICRTELPFKLPYTYIMNSDAIDDEMLSPTGLSSELTRCGLLRVDLTIEKFNLADDYGHRYPRLSRYDRIALAIAKVRRIFLLTGDGALRAAAKSENITVLGTLGILDQLLSGKFIDEKEYLSCLLELQKFNGYEVRLPKSEISLRINRLI